MMYETGCYGLNIDSMVMVTDILHSNSNKCLQHEFLLEKRKHLSSLQYSSISFFGVFFFIVRRRKTDINALFYFLYFLSNFMNIILTNMRI